MSVKLTSLKANIARENEGDWQDIPDFPGLRLKVRSLEYSPYRMARDIVVQRFARKYGRRPIPPDVQLQEFGKLYADHILLDWEGMVDDSDQPIKMTTAVALEHLTNPEYRKLVSAVEWAASAVAEGDIDFTAEAVKN